MGDENSEPKRSSYRKDTIISEELCEDVASLVDLLFLQVQLNGDNFPPQYDAKDSFSQLTRDCLKVHTIQPGKISCILSVKPTILNPYRSMHGGGVGAVAERVAIACARTQIDAFISLERKMIWCRRDLRKINGLPNKKPQNSDKFNNENPNQIRTTP